MTDREEIIQGLQIERECVSRDCDRDCARCGLVQDKDWLLSVYDGALKLLEEQEAKQVIDIADSVEGMEVGYCPSCDRAIVNKKIDKTKFCKFCGQAVMWDDIR